MPEEINFTKANIEGIEPAPKSKRVYYLDGNKKSGTLKGFGLVVSDKGSKHFVLTQYFQRDRKTVRLRCGEFPKVTIEQARKKAHELQALLLNGIHPTEHKQQIYNKRETAKAENIIKERTLQQVLNDYLDKRDLKALTKKDYRKAVNETWAKWLDKPLLDITESIVKEQHRTRSQTSKARANNAMRVLRALFNFARSEYKLPDGSLIYDHNPVTILSESRSWNKIKRRKTYLYPTELPDWFKAVKSLPNHTARDYFLFLLFTGARREESGRLLTEDVDFRSNTFTLRDTKNNDDVTLPMSSFIKKMLSDRITNDQKWVFPSDVNDSHIVDMRKQLVMAKELSGIDFTLHDLRRTFITYGESLDISTYAVKRLVNHRTGEQSDVTMGYIGEDIERLRKATQKITDYILLNAKQKEAKVIQLHS